MCHFGLSQRRLLLCIIYLKCFTILHDLVSRNLSRFLWWMRVTQIQIIVSLFVEGLRFEDLLIKSLVVVVSRTHFVEDSPTNKTVTYLQRSARVKMYPDTVALLLKHYCFFVSLVHFQSCWNCHRWSAVIQSMSSRPPRKNSLELQEPTSSFAPNDESYHTAWNTVYALWIPLKYLYRLCFVFMYPVRFLYGCIMICCHAK